MLLDYGIGLTDVAKHVHGVDSRITRADYDPDGFEAKVRTFQPRYVAFTSKQAASVYLRQRTGQIGYGLQAERICQTRLWVLPSPSGAARRSWDVHWWHELAQMLT
ncbi:MAG: mismatch-specific DNA-glycosylase [Anaerolineae bacterium]|nr:mismatch-specific DNA-glycosylase [Anaerolineae bacterium]